MEILEPFFFLNKICILQKATGKEIEKFSHHQKRCWSVDFNSIDPNLLASGSDDTKVNIWSLGCQRPVKVIGIKGEGQISDDYSKKPLIY